MWLLQHAQENKISQLYPPGPVPWLIQELCGGQVQELLSNQTNILKNSYLKSSLHALNFGYPFFWELLFSKVESFVVISQSGG